MTYGLTSKRIALSHARNAAEAFERTAEKHNHPKTALA
jgi:hypothetical protein